METSRKELISDGKIFNCSPMPSELCYLTEVKATYRYCTDRTATTVTQETGAHQLSLRYVHGARTSL